MKTQSIKQHTILWADDDPDDLMIMQEALSDLDHTHQIVEAHNGKQVLQYLASISSPDEYPCLIILDNNMPLMTGRDTLMTIRQNPRYNSIPVIIFSTSISTQERGFFESLGAFCYNKPFTIGAYRKMLAALLTHCSNEIRKVA